MRYCHKKLLFSLVLCLASAVSCPAGESVEERVGKLEQRLDQQNVLLERLLTVLESGVKSGDSKPGVPSAAVPSRGTYSANEFMPGWVARIYGLPKGSDVTVLPSVLLGSFNMDKSGYTMADASANIGLPLSSCFLWRGEGFLHVTGEGGPYTFALKTDGMGATGWVYLAIEGTTIIEERTPQYGQKVLIGGAELAPGLHRVEMRFVSEVDNNKRAGKGFKPRALFDFTIKGPNDNTPQSAMKYLLRKTG